MPSTTERLALFGTLLATFGELHPVCDQWVQHPKDAVSKSAHGAHRVYRDGTPVTDSPRHGAPTMTASAFGRRAVARHVGSYSAVQVAATVAVTRAFGYRVPARALLAGAVINAATHAVIDRRDPLIWLARRCGKRGYIEHATVVRKAGDSPVQDAAGPGTALMELDQALHRAIGVGAAALTTWLATRKAGRR